MQPTRDQLRALAATVLDDGHYLGDEEDVEMAQGVRHLLDELDQAEARIDRVRDQIREPWAPSPDGDVVLVETLRNILDPDCGRGPCCLGDGHDGDCRL